jgi:hypothetical protein
MNHILLMGTQMAPETSVMFNQLTRLTARQHFIKHAVDLSSFLFNSRHNHEVVLNSRMQLNFQSGTYLGWMTLTNSSS